MYVIRYQLGDSVVVSNEPCQCGPDAITLHLAPELPQVNPRSGKLRYVLKMLPPASTTTPAARTHNGVSARPGSPGQVIPRASLSFGTS